MRSILPSLAARESKMPLRKSRWSVALIPAMFAFLWFGCSVESGLSGASCDNEGERDGNRVCKSGYWVQVGDAYTSGADVPANCEPSTEVCNGSDDDCDGVTDEGCGCHYRGKNTGVCTDGMRNTKGDCQPPSAYNESESVHCDDGKDNDCDGKLDEKDDDCACKPGESRECYSGPSGTAGEGICKKGNQKCDGGTWGPCNGEETPARNEKCGDGKDNDCDGATDNACTCDYQGKSKGICTGLMTNANGDCPQPSGYEKPTDSEAQCDGKDNDCDGATDEACICDYKGKSTGVCKGSTKRDKQGNCPKPSDYESSTNKETCDGKDNDCDGKTDEGDCQCTPGTQRTCYRGPAGTAGTGICEAGKLRCKNDGTWSSCTGEVQPRSSESCNRKDDDCDGVTDEGCPCDYRGHSTGVCTNGRRSSTGRCSRPAGWMSRTNDERPRCDGKDNDCDGRTDERCNCTNGKTTRCGKSTGECSRGYRYCNGGNWSNCQGGQGPTSESCDNKDNDCDGNTDEKLSRGCGMGSNACSSCDGVCSKATESCSGGSWSCQNPSHYESSESSCDNRDNDCDGSTDESLTRSCGMSTGQCTKGMETCSGGSWGSCSGQGSSSEKCDSKDHDCDGQTNDVSRGCGSGSGACSSCDGVCSNASETCSSDSWSCQTPSGYESTESTCDGKDNDCDGQTDESLSRGCGMGSGACSSCQGVCNNATETCSGGGWSCQTPTDYSSNETDCDDGVDNDCDGTTDEATKSNGETCSKDCECMSDDCGESSNKCESS
mgnify:CR=1 FL=1